MSAETRVSHALRGIARDLDHQLRDIAGEKMGFVLIVAPLNRLGGCSHVRNVTHAGALAMVAQCAEEFAVGSERVDVPLHKVQ